EENPELPDTDEQTDGDNRPRAHVRPRHEEDRGESGQSEAQGGKEKRRERLQADVNHDEVHRPADRDDQRYDHVPARHQTEAATTNVMPVRARGRRRAFEVVALTSASPRWVTSMGARSEDPRPRHPSAHQVASDAACSGGNFVGKRGSGIRFPSRRKPAPVSASAKAPPHQMVSGDVPSSTPPTAGPRATPTMKLSW